jgi:hypothetical protein
VKDETPRDAGEWFRWGGIPVEHQASSIRAVVDALAKRAAADRRRRGDPHDRARRVGLEPVLAQSRNRRRCGLFQFVRATWAATSAAGPLLRSAREREARA